MGWKQALQRALIRIQAEQMVELVEMAEVVQVMVLAQVPDIMAMAFYVMLEQLRCRIQMAEQVEMDLLMQVH
jgi:hypothetical protein